MQPIIDAIERGDEAAVAMLLEHEVVETPSGPVRPLLFALYRGKPQVARMMIDRGAKLTFAEACAVGELERAKELLAANPEVLNERTPDGFPPLGLAIFFRQPDVARWLIEQGADVTMHAANAQRVAPLHAAAAVCDRETMALLLEKGADPNARQQLDYTPLHGAASRGDIAMAELLLGHGADLHARGSDGVTPADVARKYGQEEMAQWLDSRA